MFLFKQKSLENNLVSLEIGQFNTKRTLGLFNLINSEKQQFYVASDFQKQMAHLIVHKILIDSIFIQNITSKLTIKIGFLLHYFILKANGMRLVKFQKEQLIAA